MSAQQPTIREICDFLLEIYGWPNDRLYSSYDLLYYNQKFLFRFLSSNGKKAEENFLISFSWFIAFINRFHIDLGYELLKRYPYKCPICLDLPCTCNIKTHKKITSKSGRPPSRKPQSFKDWQSLMNQIYPSNTPSKVDIIEANDSLTHRVRKFTTEHKNLYYKNVLTASADFFSLYLRMANNLNIDFTKNIKVFFKNGCYACYKKPCICNFYD